MLKVNCDNLQSECGQISKIELYAKIFKDFQQLINFTESSILDVWQGSQKDFVPSPFITDIIYNNIRIKRILISSDLIQISTDLHLNNLFNVSNKVTIRKRYLMRLLLTLNNKNPMFIYSCYMLHKVNITNNNELRRWVTC